MKAALGARPLGVPGADRLLERAARDRQEPDARPERAPIVCRVSETYATGRFTKQQVLEQARYWGLTNRRNRPLTSQAIGMLLRIDSTPTSWTSPSTAFAENAATSSP